MNTDISTWFYTGEFPNGSQGKITAKYDFDVDWGDGSPLEHYNNSMGENRSNKRIPVKHQYHKLGTYKVTITGDCDNLFGYGMSGHDTCGDNSALGTAKDSDTLKYCLWGVQVPTDHKSPLKYGYGSFFGCENLKFIGYGVFENITECREVPHLYDGAVLSRIEPWMLQGGINLENIEYTFENCQMMEIDAQVFQNCPNVTKANHCFHRCNSLLSIPNGLFDYFPKLENVESCFKSCSNLTFVPENLFDNCPNITDFSYCFCGGQVANDYSYPRYMKITSSLPPMWERMNDSNFVTPTSFNDYATGCIKAKNYITALWQNPSWANE